MKRRRKRKRWQRAVRLSTQDGKSHWRIIDGTGEILCSVWMQEGFRLVRGLRSWECELMPGFLVGVSVQRLS